MLRTVRPSRSGSVVTSAMRAPRSLRRPICESWSRSSSSPSTRCFLRASTATEVQLEQMVLQMTVAAAVPDAPMVSALEPRSQAHSRRHLMCPDQPLSCLRRSAQDSFPALLLHCFTLLSYALQMPCWRRPAADTSSRRRLRLPTARCASNPATCAVSLPLSRDAAPHSVTCVCRRPNPRPALSLHDLSLGPSHPTTRSAQKACSHLAQAPGRPGPAGSEIARVARFGRPAHRA